MDSAARKAGLVRYNNWQTRLHRLGRQGRYRRRRFRRYRWNRCRRRRRSWCRCGCGWRWRSKSRRRGNFRTRSRQVYFCRGIFLFAEKLVVKIIQTIDIVSGRRLGIAYASTCKEQKKKKSQRRRSARQNSSSFAMIICECIEFCNLLFFPFSDVRLHA